MLNSFDPLKKIFKLRHWHRLNFRKRERERERRECDPGLRRTLETKMTKPNVVGKDDWWSSNKMGGREGHKL